MADAPEQLIRTELVHEVESYLPSMREFLIALTENSQNKTAAKELYRMTHTIKGAAAMVKLDELSKAAAIMETALDDITAGKLAWNTKLIGAMESTVKHINAYCTALHRGEEDGNDLYQKAHRAFEKLGHYPSNENAESGDDDDFLFPDDAKDLADFLTDDESQDSSDDFFNLFSEEDASLDKKEDPGTLFDKLGDDESSEPENPFDIDHDGAKDTIDSELEAEIDLPPETSAIDPELLEIFNEEVAEHLGNIGHHLNQLSSSITVVSPIDEDNREVLHSVRRSVHTLKGAAAVIGIEPVAEWGHDFEDFLDWLHDDSAKLSPKIVSAMLDGADILEKISTDPSLNVEAETGEVKETFSKIMSARTDEAPLVEHEIQEERDDEKSATIESSVDAATEKEPSSSDYDELKDVAKTIETTESPSVEKKPVVAFSNIKPMRRPERRKGKRIETKTLRVDVAKIDEMVGLGGDMAINLGSFDDSVGTMRSSLHEFESTLQRLRNITASLEAGYELATIPHLGRMVGPDEDGVMEEFDPLEMDRYSELNIMIRSLNETVADLDSIREHTTSVYDTWRRTLDRHRGVLGEMRNSIGLIRMNSFSILANRLHRTVREAARATDKKVRLQIEGLSLRMDAQILDVIADPLMHMLRNSVDHGVETIKMRQKAGKPEQAIIRLHVSRRGTQFIIRVIDDGKGLDYEGIKKRAFELYPELDVATMDNKDLAELIFRQGFSSSSEVTPMSGRGVGMDVVRYGVEKLNGTIKLNSTPGIGLEFIIRLPVVVTQLPGLLVRFGYQEFMVPMREVIRVLKADAADSTKDSFNLKGEVLPLIRPAELMQFENSFKKSTGAVFSEDKPLLLLVDTGFKRGVIYVDEMMGQREVVFKDLGSHLYHVPFVSGVTILGNGALVPILNVEDLLGSERTTVQVEDEVVKKSTEKEKILTILIADDSISIRKVMGNFIATQGWRPITANDGIDAMEKVRENNPDLVLLDIEMPRMNGFEVLQSMQAQSVYRDIPVLMLTSRSAQKYKDKAKDLGVRGFVTKPFKDEELLSLITGLVGQKK